MAAHGDDRAVGQLCELHRDQLRRMVRVRLHPLVRTRVDESDIVQNAFLFASQHVADYFDGKSDLPFYIWLRRLTNRQIQQTHRQHLDADKRSVRQDHLQQVGDGSLSFCMAAHIVSQDTSPSSAAMRDEVLQQVNNVLDGLNETDREILCMRHFEQMSNAEVAAALELTPTNASTRHLRALVKLHKGLAAISPDLVSQFR